MMDTDELETDCGRAADPAPVVANGPYTMEVQPRSPGRIFLARAFAHFCTVHRGLPDREIEAAFDGAGTVSTVSYVRTAAGLLGDLLATAALRSFARPFGGGEALPLPSSIWEVDDVRDRFTSSAIDPARPFGEDVAPTHWLFVDMEDWNEIMEASLADVVSSKPRRTVSTPVERDVPATIRPPEEIAAPTGDRLLRLPEVERRTGLSKSTIYRRIEGGRFPASVPMTGNIALWRESEVAGWIADPV